MSNNCSPKCECKTGGEVAPSKKPYDVVEGIMMFEQGDASNEDVIDLFAHLVKTGMAWTLQGSYGRSAASLIERGFISPGGEVLKYSEED